MVFDDADLEIVAEPFVGSINSMIDMYANGRKNITAFISSQPIPNNTLCLIKVEGEGMYQLEGTDIVGWLCPCLLNYFPSYVDRIYVLIQ